MSVDPDADLAPDPGADDVLQTALERLRLEGAIFFRSELTEGFAFESRPAALAAALHPGAERVIIFHIVAAGSCWVAADDGVRHRAETGDVIVLPYGDRHVIGGDAPAECVPINSLIDPLPWDHLPTIRHGGGGERVDLVCGYLYSEDPLFDPAMRVFPPAFVVQLPEGATAGWVRASVAYALEESVPSNVSSNPVSTRLPELVLIEVLRLHLATAPAADQGWVAALRDPVLAPALVAAAPRARAEVDGGRPGRRGQRVALVARRALPPGARSLADPVPHRVAHAPGRGAPRHCGPRRGRGVTSGRLRLRGGVQPGVQAIARPLPEPLAFGPGRRFGRELIDESARTCAKSQSRPGGRAIVLGRRRRGPFWVTGSSGTNPCRRTNERGVETMAARSVSVTFTNKTTVALVRSNGHLDHGVWSTEPPLRIEVGQTVGWESESDGVATGTEGEVHYDDRRDRRERHPVRTGTIRSSDRTATTSRCPRRSRPVARGAAATTPT